MLHRWRLWLAMILLLSAGAFAPLLWQWRVEATYAPSTFSLEQAPMKRVAIVLGARVYSNGRLSGMLRDRVETAVALYKAGKVQKILMSGDNSQEDYNEPGAMMAYAVGMGVDPADIQPDFGGRRTYDTCYRAKQIFQVDEAIVVTQAFHLPRALFLCDQLGVDAVGVVADQRRYDPRSIAWSESRELPATLAALIDVVRRAPPPVLGEPIPIH
ncbi:MAG: YdcF family protein [Anaerolineales bacterium]|nr:YdcF family protein [Anaerolineales bacterium]